MPALVARAHEEGAAGDRRADRAIVDQLARGLVAAAEERVRRAADAEILGRREVHHLARLGYVDAERLFRMHMLAGVEHCQADIGVGQRHREVDHDLDVVALQQLIDAHRRHAELGAALLGGFAAHIGHGLDFEDGKALRRLQVGGADNATADDADADFSHSCSPFVSMRPDATAIP